MYEGNIRKSFGLHCTANKGYTLQALSVVNISPDTLIQIKSVICLLLNKQNPQDKQQKGQLGNDTFSGLISSQVHNISEGSQSITAIYSDV